MEEGKTGLKKESTTHSKFYLPEVDGLRFFAFLLVFIHHHTLFSQIPSLSVLHEKGWLGVDLFFVLSAFLFAKLLRLEYDQTNTISIKKFFIRRIFRIWPVYFFYLIIIIPIHFFEKGWEDPSYLATRLVGLVTFTDNIFASFSGYSPIKMSSHLWTIGYEEQFYLIIPLLMLSLVKMSAQRKIAFALFVYAMLTVIKCILIVFEAKHPAMWVLPVTHFESILLGIVIAFIDLKKITKHVSPALLLILGIIGMFYIIPLFPSSDEYTYLHILKFLVVGLATTITVVAVLESKKIKHFFAYKTLVFLGKRSYGLYLYHFLGMYLADIVLAHNPIIPDNQSYDFVTSLLLTVVISILSYRLIERPFLKLKKRYEIIQSRPI